MKDDAVVFHRALRSALRRIGQAGPAEKRGPFPRSLLAVAAALCGACDGGSPPGRPIERVQAVGGKPPAAATPEEFCDFVAAPDEARAFRYPKLAAAQPPAGARWRRINVWATWCVPCVEEIPMLVEWEAQLKRGGTPVDLVLVSLDADDATVERFRRRHPQAPPSLRMKDLDRAEAWIVSLGLDAGATLPIHVFVDPRGGIRCARTGRLDRAHRDVVRRILAAR